MPTHAFFDGYAGLEFTLPNGRPVKVPALRLERAAYFLRLAERMEAEPDVKYTILKEFPAEIGLVEQLNELTLPEFWEVFWVFFGRRVRPGEPPPVLAAASPGMSS